MAVRAAETMTTGSEPAFILPQGHSTRYCGPDAPAREEKPSPEEGGPHCGAESQATPPTAPASAAAQARGWAARVGGRGGVGPRGTDGETGGALAPHTSQAFQCCIFFFL